MKIKLLILVFGCSLVIPANLNAQVGNLLKNRLKTNEKTTAGSDKKVENKVINFKDRLIGSIVGGESSDSVQIDDQDENQASPAGSGANALSGMFSNGAPLKHKEIYRFNGKIVTEMEGSDDESEFEGTVLYTTYINTSNNDFAFEMSILSDESSANNGTIIQTVCDIENNLMMMLTDMNGQKTAIATNLDAIEEMDDEEAENLESENYTYTKTGTTKTILGYKCDGYFARDGEKTFNLWISRDIPFKPAMKEMEKAGVPMFLADEEFEGGMVMEMEWFENNIKKGYMLVKEIDDKANKSIQIGEYTIINMTTEGL